MVIKIFSENDTLCIENNLQVREQIKESSGIGLANIVQRYALLTKKNVFIEKSEDYFKVKLPVLSSKSNTFSVIPENKNESYERAQKRVKEIKSFYSNLISYCIIIPFLVIINLLTTPENIWFFFPMLGWGIGVAAHGMSVFAIGKKWEEKRSGRFLKNNTNNKF
uniref:2TM domain-containing protein n=1 Tax=Chryseobacterium endophyticum TaxID=1854762 RepID=A0AAU6WQP0_9FLAO